MNDGAVRVDLGTMRLGEHLRSAMVISLEAGEFLRLQDSEGVEVRCESGQLWISRELAPGDLWLGDGQSAVAGAQGLTFIEAIAPTRLSIFRAEGRTG